MPKNNTQKPQSIETPTVSKSYDAGDLCDLASLAESDMDWMHTALFDVKIKIAQIKENLIKQNPSIEYAFCDVEKILEMYVYLAENRQQHHAKEAEKFGALLQAESEANKKVVTL